MTLLAFLGSTDHKVIAIRELLTSALFFLMAGVLALLIRTELAQPGLQVVSHAGYTQLFSMHGSTMVFLVVIPLALAFCTYFVPLQVGAADIALPRVALAGSWLHPLGGLVMWSGWLTREGPGRAGWYSYDPLAETINTPGSGMDLWVCGVILATLGSLLVGACLLWTIVRRRAPGMTLLRMPFFTWTALVTALLVVFSFPSLVVAMSLLLLDRHGASLVDPIGYQHWFWFYGHPAVYVMFFPFVGMTAEAAAVFARRRFFGYKVGVVAIVAFAVLSVGAYGHHMLTTGAVPDDFFALASTAIIVPAGIEYFEIIGTLWKGALQLKVSLLFVVAFLVQFFVGGATGFWVASPVLDLHVHDSYFIVAHFHYTLFAGSLFGMFAGLYLWWPKITGRFLSERLGYAHFALLVVGTNLTFLPQFFLGHAGMARRLADYPADQGWGTANLLSSIGAYAIALSTALFVVSATLSLLRRPTAGPDPWEGHSLEWATPSSPPPRHNFDRLPPIRSFAPLYDLRHEGEEEGGEPGRGADERQPQAAGAGG